MKKVILILVCLFIFLPFNHVYGQVVAGFSCQDTVCHISPVQFSDTSLGNPTSWAWNFGDPGSGLNNTSIQQNPVHIFTAPNVYNVTLIACNGAQCDTTIVPITVNSRPDPYISGPSVVLSNSMGIQYSTHGYLPYWGCGSHQMTWTVAGQAGIVNGQGTCSVDLATGGADTCTICVNDLDPITGCDSTYCTTFYIVNQAPQISWGYWPANPCASMPVSFSAMTDYNVIGWQWDFGDGSGSTSQNPTHTYAAPGLYNVTAHYFEPLTWISDTVSFTILIDSSCANFDLISGNVYYDQNSNGSRDSLEPGLQGMLIEINPGGGYLSTDANGNYAFYQSAGTWSIKQIHPAAYLQTQPAQPAYSVTCNNTSSAFGGNNFGLYYPPNQDLQVYSGGPPAIPGFSRSQYIHVKNAGTLPMSGSVVFTFDSSLTFQSAQGGSVSGSTVTYIFSNLSPNNLFISSVKLYADTANVHVGDLLCYNTVVNPIAGDSAPANNVHNMCQYTVAAWDPNDKNTQIGNDAIANGQNLEFTVRFQNTGNAPANTVTIRDTLDPNLDLSTFTMLGASHNYSWNLYGNVLTVNFPNIVLPDSFTNEPASHGWLSYSLDPKPGLSTNTHIYNRAGIYFDFNPVVLTNATDNWIGMPVENAAFSANDSIFCAGDSISFNDLSDNLPTSWKWLVTGPASFSSTQQNPTFVLDTAGTYTIQLYATNALGGDTLIKSSWLSVIQKPEVTLNKSDITCFGLANGFAAVSVTKGLPPYSYSWSNGGTTNINNSLTPGIHTVIITDSNGCMVTDSVNIVQPAAINISGNVTAAVCGIANGSASVNISGGTPGYSLNWSNGAGSTNITGLSAGNYSVTVTDSLGCQDSLQLSVADIPGPALNVTFNPVSCNGGSNGTASVNVTGGTSPISYNWSTGANGSNISGLAAGVYSISVSDSNGCMVSDTFTVTEPSQLGTILTTSAGTCGLSNGAITALVTGGTPGYSYSWNNGATTSIVSGLSAGLYSVIVTDSNGCSQTDSVQLNNSGAPVVIANEQEPSCNKSSDGSVSATASGGTPPYTWSWNTGNITSSVSGLGAGTYTITVSDSAGCQSIDSVVLTAPPALILSGSSTPDNSSGNGTATVTASGGLSPYNYLWNDSSGQTTATANGLNAGIYTVIVTDANNCSDTLAVTVDLLTNTLENDLRKIISIHPNPTSGILQLQGSVSKPITIQVRVMNLSGQILKEKTLVNWAGDQVEINISDFANGEYIVEIQNSDQLFRKKIFKRD